MSCAFCSGAAKIKRIQIPNGLLSHIVAPYYFRCGGAVDGAWDYPHAPPVLKGESRPHLPVTPPGPQAWMTPPRTPGVDDTPRTPGADDTAAPPAPAPPLTARSLSIFVHTR